MRRGQVVLRGGQVAAERGQIEIAEATARHGQARATTGRHGQPDATTGRHGQARVSVGGHGQIHPSRSTRAHGQTHATACERRKIGASTVPASATATATKCRTRVGVRKRGQIELTKAAAERCGGRSCVRSCLRSCVSGREGRRLARGLLRRGQITRARDRGQVELAEAATEGGSSGSSGSRSRPCGNGHCRLLRHRGAERRRGGRPGRSARRRTKCVALRLDGRRQVDVGRKRGQIQIELAEATACSRDRRRGRSGCRSSRASSGCTALVRTELRQVDLANAHADHGRSALHRCRRSRRACLCTSRVTGATDGRGGSLGGDDERVPALRAAHLQSRGGYAALVNLVRRMTRFALDFEHRDKEYHR